MNRYAVCARLQVAEQVEDRGLNRHVERRHRLVADDQVRIRRECARDADALLLAAGKLIRQPVEIALVEPHGAQQLRRLVDRLCSRQSTEQRERPRQRLADRALRIQCRVGVLEHHLQPAPHVALALGRAAFQFVAVEADRAIRGFDEADDQARERRLAAAALADNRQRLVGRELKADAVERMDDSLLSEDAEQLLAVDVLAREVVDGEQRTPGRSVRAVCRGRSGRCH